MKAAVVLSVVLLLSSAAALAAPGGTPPLGWYWVKDGSNDWYITNKPLNGNAFQSDAEVYKWISDGWEKQGSSPSETNLHTINNPFDSTLTAPWKKKVSSTVASAEYLVLPNKNVYFPSVPEGYIAVPSGNTYDLVEGRTTDVLNPYRNVDAFDGNMQLVRNIYNDNGEIVGQLLKDSFSSFSLRDPRTGKTYSLGNNVPHEMDPSALRSAFGKNAEAVAKGLASGGSSTDLARIIPSAREGKTNGQAYYIVDSSGRRIYYDPSGNIVASEVLPGSGIYRSETGDTAAYYGSDGNKIADQDAFTKICGADGKNCDGTCTYVKSCLNAYAEEYYDKKYYWLRANKGGLVWKGLRMALEWVEWANAIEGALETFGYVPKRKNFENDFGAFLQDPQGFAVSKICYQGGPSNPSGMIAGPTGLPSARIEGRRQVITGSPINCPYNAADNAAADEYCKKWGADKCGEESFCTLQNGEPYRVEKRYIYVITFTVDPRTILGQDSDTLKMRVVLKNTGKGVAKVVDLNGKKNLGGETIQLAKKDREFEATLSNPLIRMSQTEYDRVCIEFLNDKDDFSYAFYNNWKNSEGRGNNPGVCNDFVHTQYSTSGTGPADLLSLGFYSGGWFTASRGGTSSSSSSDETTSEGRPEITNNPADMEV